MKNLSSRRGSLGYPLVTNGDRKPLYVAIGPRLDPVSVLNAARIVLHVVQSDENVTTRQFVEKT